jgi:hypothetical protein
LRCKAPAILFTYLALEVRFPLIFVQDLQANFLLSSVTFHSAPHYLSIILPIPSILRPCRTLTCAVLQHLDHSSDHARTSEWRTSVETKWRARGCKCHLVAKRGFMLRKKCTMLTHEANDMVIMMLRKLFRHNAHYLHTPYMRCKIFANCYGGVKRPYYLAYCSYVRDVSELSYCLSC